MKRGRPLGSKNKSKVPPTAPRRCIYCEATVGKVHIGGAWFDSVTCVKHAPSGRMVTP